VVIFDKRENEMNNYRLTIQYDGSRYKGWQRLGEGEATIQAKIEHVLSEMMGKEIKIIGASRTDAGVHALMQVANFQLQENVGTDEIQMYLNRYLPDDIWITEVTEVFARFHARHNASSKTYLYKVLNSEIGNPFMRAYSIQIKETLDLKLMRAAAQELIGEHDFTTFTNAKSKKKSMVRTIESINLEKRKDMIEIRITGNGFLHNMVRRIVGTLIEVGSGNLKPKTVKDILIAKERSGVSMIAKPQGLYLENIEYS
jgi:tRNA pseudouridine38-40 synthase